jgi:nicotinate-nucleotide pyrophosphorylase (carboxylating)
MKNQKLFNLWAPLLHQGLAEDGYPWDWTSIGIGQSSHKKIRARVLAKSDGIWAAEGLTRSIEGWTASSCTGESLEVTSQILLDGSKFKANDILLELTGGAVSLLTIERPFLNLAAYACGIATATRRIVERVQQACPVNPPRVTLTRKTLPYYRDLAIHGVRMGGGFPHRTSLAGGILIKENHIAAAGSLKEAIRGVRAVAPHGLKIEVEVRSQEELHLALACEVEALLLDNFSPDQLKAALKSMQRVQNHPLQRPIRPILEVSGGLNESNISSYALPDVDLLSVGSLTHSVHSADLSFLLDDSSSQA